LVNTSLEQAMATDLREFDNLKVERAGARLHVTLNRPETRNALSRDMVRELLVVADLLEHDASIASVVLRGAAGTFCAGGDIKGFMASINSPPPPPGEKDSIARGNRDFGTLLSRFDALPQTVVVVVEGAAYGGGLGLVCVGDVVAAAADTRFALSETGLGVPPAQIAPFVAARIGVPQARRLALAGARFDGREAARIGLVDFVCDDAGALEATVAKLLADIARCAPGANAATKRLLLASLTTPRDRLLDEAADAFAQCLRGPEGREGVTAFLEKRLPRWVDAQGHR
jgi:isohexenylglutaconyl-CoA hydratase